MASKQFTKAFTALAAAGVVAVGGLVMRSVSIAQTTTPTTLDQMVQIGLNIAPVKLNLTGKDPTLVGLGSFIVNAVADCNGCHNSNPTGSEYGSTNNPYLLPPYNYPPKVQAQYYLGGGGSFGPAGAGVVSSTTSPYYAGPGNGPLIIARNLTPDITGLPEGGHTLQQFLTIIQTGYDYDHLHPTCGGTVTTNCYYAPTNGAVLQVMPWAVFANMTEYQLTAIWTYLSAIPCIANTGSPYANLINVCPSH
jgi:hypothetical protein